MLLGRLRLQRPPPLPEPEPADPGDHSPTRILITTRRHPVFYMAITKCGCTFMKQLMYRLDSGQNHPAGAGIHDHPQDLVRAKGVPVATVQLSPFAMTVLRDPAARILSFYTDKVYGTHDRGFAPLRHMLADREGIDLSPGLTEAAHRTNLLKLLDWVARNLAGETAEPANQHWKKQSARLRRARDLKLTALTLDGLDWQLPSFWGPAIPDIANQMAAIRDRNASPKPAGQRILDDDLRRSIDRVYAEDREAYDQATEDWAARSAPAAPSIQRTGGQARLTVLTTHSAPVATIAVPKAGCTFLRNLFYRIDHGRPHPDPQGIAADGCLVKASLTAEELAERRAFVLVRDPVDRFLSLYFDKVLGQGPHAFPWIARQLATKGFVAEGASLDQHKVNCRRLIGFIEGRMARQGRERVNAHWRPQSVSVDKALAFGLVPIPLEAADARLTELLSPHIPGIADLIAACRADARNKSRKPVRPAHLRGPRLVRRIHAAYPDDLALIRQARG